MAASFRDFMGIISQSGNAKTIFGPVFNPYSGIDVQHRPANQSAADVTTFAASTTGVDKPLKGIDSSQGLSVSVNQN